MSQDKSREDFEAWHESAYPESKGGYRSPAAWYHWNNKKEMRWEAWQASRAAVVVDLPEAYATDADGCWMLPRREVQDAIEAAGLKVAP